jgi:hypothetical protein
MRTYQRAHASVRFFGESLDPLDVTLALRLPPDHVHRRGEPRLGRSQKGHVVEYSPYRDGMWSMSSDAWVQSPRLAVHLEWLLNQLEPKKVPIQDLIEGGAKVDFFCFSSGTTPKPPALPRSIRDRANALGIEILIDHYDLTPEAD